jgi:hypothetical protein
MLVRNYNCNKKQFNNKRLLNLYNAIAENTTIKGGLFECLIDLAFENNKMQSISHLTQNV